MREELTHFLHACVPIIKAFFSSLLFPLPLVPYRRALTRLCFYTVPDKHGSQQKARDTGDIQG